VKNIRNVLGTIVVLVLSIIQIAEAKPKEKFALVIHGGAGTYANNETCAVSATGTREYFIRAAVAHDISALMEYKRYSLIKASKKVIQKVGKLGGSGGVIGIGAKGNIATPFNTKGMYRGYIKSDGKAVTLIYKND